MLAKKSSAPYDLRPSTARLSSPKSFDLQPTTILVTGCAGFIGSHLTEKLLALGHRVIGIDDFNDFYDPKIKWNNIKDLQNNDRFILHKADIRDTKKILAIFKKYANAKQLSRPTTYDLRPSTVIHLAARAGVRPSLKDPLLYQDVNIRGTMNILEACRQNGIKRLLFASSSSVYGNNEKVPFAESDPVDNPISPYAATKKAGELLCYTYHHLYKLPIACLRFFTVYGPRQRPEMAIHSFIRMIDQGQEIAMFGDGSTCRDYTFIEDIQQGLIACLSADLGYEIINLGNSQTVTLKTLIHTIEAALGKQAKIKKMPKQPGDVERTFADISKAKKTLGYAPSTDISSGIKKMVTWYVQNSKK